MKKIVLIIFLFSLNYSLFSQEEDNEYSDSKNTEFKGMKNEKKKLDLSRIRVGGDFGLGFSVNTFFAEVSPIIGYQVIRHRLEGGLGLVYQHQSRAKTYTINNIGGQAYIRGYIFSGIFAQIDGFLVNFNSNNKLNQVKNSFTYGNGFVGVGYAFNHENAPFYMSISVKTNIIKDNVYTSRLIIPKIGFQFRLQKPKTD